MSHDRNPFARPSDRLAPAELHGQDRIPAYALLDNIRSVGNVGSIFRTADAVNLGGLYLCGMTGTPPRPDMEKTALGATETVPWDYWRQPGDILAELHARGVQVVALEQTPGAIPYDGFAYTFPVCFVVGHEVDGVSPSALALADATVEISMSGAKKSLNVAVGFGLMAFEIRRQWLRTREAGS
ncbi:TrmH family RNA methyltransferase [bacterium]|nr:TrmH family RNA methyltransferase [bacterium]MBU1071666.1 TrmH family RNA methyltransferase [bacterium]MBU1676811.1 TrmH family RNA methyltransferase [bacterium]